MRRTPVAAALVLASLVAGPALAQQGQHSAAGQEDKDWPMPQACASTPSGSQASAQEQAPQPEASANADAPAFVQEFDAALAKMREAMPDDPSADPDVDFVRRVIPHHQGLVDMSQAYLDHAEDDMIKKQAELFIVSQKGQIAMLCDWLEKHRS